MSTNNSQNLEDSGEIVFKQSTVVQDPGNSGSPCQGNQSAVSGSSQPENVIMFNSMQQLFLEQFSSLNDKINEKFENMNDKIQGQMQTIQNEVDTIKLHSVPDRQKSGNPISQSTPNFHLEGNMGFQRGAPIDDERGQNWDFLPRADNWERPNSRNRPRFHSHMPNMNENMGNSPMENTHASHGHAKPRNYDGNEDFEDYLSHFEILSELNQWDYYTKSLQLASKLSGSALGILAELNETQKRDFNSLVKALRMRFGSLERSEMFRARLKARTRGKNESLSELAQSVKKLTRQAYPTADPQIIDLLSLDQFIDALHDPDMKFRIRESRPKNINEAETTAIRLETYKLADSQQITNTSNVNLITSGKENSILEKNLEKLDKKNE